jgi:NAD(P)-dependent dehydrogenase (short-subunit alcohol dehydrogenase family)
MPGALLEISTEAWHDALSLTLDANVFGFQTIVPLMPAGGSVVFTTSVHGLLGFRSFPGYAAAKGALTALTRQLAIEYAPDIRVNAVAPGAVLTAIWKRRDEGFRRAVAARVPMKRIADAAEVAAPIAFLLSADASYITGQTLVVDGGRSVASGE